MRALIPRLMFSAVFLFIAACSNSPKKTESLAIETKKFSGVLPCENCTGISTELILKRNTASDTPAGFFLHEVKIDSPGGERVNSLWGEWSQKSNNTNQKEVVYILHPEVGEARYYQVHPDGKLEPIDTSGQPLNNRNGTPVALQHLVTVTQPN